jgi:hypothetical protein
VGDDEASGDVVRAMAGVRAVQGVAYKYGQVQERWEVERMGGEGEKAVEESGGKPLPRGEVQKQPIVTHFPFFLDVRRVVSATTRAMSRCQLDKGSKNRYEPASKNDEEKVLTAATFPPSSQSVTPPTLPAPVVVLLACSPSLLFGPRGGRGYRRLACAVGEGSEGREGMGQYSLGERGGVTRGRRGGQGRTKTGQRTEE